MKTKFLLNLILIFCVICVALLAVGGAGGYAFAEEFALQSVTSVNASGEVVPFDYCAGEYGRGIKFAFTSSAEQYDYKIYYKSSGVYTKVGEKYNEPIVDGTFYITPSQSGELKLEVTVGETIKTYEFKADNIAPYEPNVDTGEIYAQHIAPYSVAYSLNVDNDSGIDFDKSYYYITTWSGDILVDKTAIIPGEVPYGEKYISGINSACRLIFKLYDLAGNSAEYNYRSGSYGIDYSGIPEIKVTPDGEYAKSVTVSIDWGEAYNKNPYAKKYYAVSSSLLSPVKQNYESEFVLETENATVYAYYYDAEGKEKTISKEITNVDATPPSASLLEERFSVSVDLKISDALQVKVYAYDSGSGIGKVYDNYGNIYTSLGDGYYTLSLSDTHTFNVIAEDLVGNKASYGYSNAGLDFATMKEYSKKFKSLQKVLYSESGWSAIVSAYNSLNLYLVDGSANSSGIAKHKQAIDEAIAAEITCVTRFTSVPSGLNEFALLSGMENTNALLGDVIRLNIGKLQKTDEEISQMAANAKSLSGFESGNVYTFSAKLTKDDGTDVVSKGSTVFSFKVSEGFVDAKLYCIDENGEAKEVSILTEDNCVVTAYTTAMGDFVLVTNNLIEQKEGFALWKAIVIAVAIIIVVAVVVFAIVYNITKRRY